MANNISKIKLPNGTTYNVKDTISGYTTNIGTVTQVKVGSTAYNPSSGVVSLPAYPTTLPASDTVSTYSSTGTAPVNGKGVAAALATLPSPMVFKGSLGTGGTITALPVNGSATIGDTYKVITAGTYASKSAKVGDTFICLTKTSSANTWELIPSGDEPSGTVTSVKLANATNGGLTISGTNPVTTSGTINVGHTNIITAGTAKGDDSKTLTFGGTFTIPSVTYDVNGHITAKGTTTMTMPANPNSDTKVTVSSSDPTSQTVYYPTVATGAGTGGLNYVPNISYLTKKGTTSTNGYSYLVLGNSTDVGADGNKFGGVVLYSKTGSHYAALTASDDMSGTSDNTYLKLPITSGTLALTSATVSTVTWDSTNKKLTKTIDGTTTDVVTGATILGGLTKSQVTTALGYTPPTSDTNNAVTQTATTTNASYEVLFSATADNTTRTEGARKTSSLTYNPNSKTLNISAGSDTLNAAFIGITGTNTHTWLSNGNIDIMDSVGWLNLKSDDIQFLNTSQTWDGTNNSLISALAGKLSISGNAASASKLSNVTKIGDTNKPVYFTANGEPSAISYTIDKSVPSNAVFTDQYVTQSASTNNATYEVLFSGTADNTTRTEGAKKNSNLTFNPSTGTLTATAFSGPLTGNVTGNCSGTSSNVTGTVAIANGGTGATTRLNAVKALTNENVGTEAQYFVTIKGAWTKAGYSSVANVKSVLGLGTYSAGSSSAGGSATSAEKLNTDAGSYRRPIYFNSGIPVNCNFFMDSKDISTGNSAAFLYNTGDICLVIVGKSSVDWSMAFIDYGGGIRMIRSASSLCSIQITENGVQVNNTSSQKISAMYIRSTPSTD